MVESQPQLKKRPRQSSSALSDRLHLQVFDGIITFNPHDGTNLYRATIHDFLNTFGVELGSEEMEVDNLSTVKEVMAVIRTL
jgi:hypothetical protein